MSPRIAVALSGGVDSAVAAARLVDTGASVLALTMKTAQAAPGPTGHQGCCGLQDVDDARRVAQHLGIPHYVVDLTAPFERDVIAPFVAQYLQGETPNPCVACNNHIKFGSLLDHARRLGADRVATGHYARVGWDAECGRWTLARSADPTKDQTYVLGRLTQAQLGAALFPLGDAVKEDVRAEAAARGLPVARKPDSQEICFIPHNDYRAFVAGRAPEAVLPGPIRDADTGRVLGEHMGVANFTVGQRRGLGLGGAAAPQFVVGLDAGSNTVLVGPPEAVAAGEMELRHVEWVSRRSPAGRIPVLAKIRHQHTAVEATLQVVDDNRVIVAFSAPQRAVTPGQTAVCYVDNFVLCGGEIARTGSR